MVEFIGRKKKVENKALVSLDNSYWILIETEDPVVMEIGRWPADESFKVKIEKDNGTT